MKVAVVFDNMIYGGIERVGISHIKLLKELGHDVTSYVLTPKTEPIVDELREICGVRIVNLPRKFCPEAYWVITRRYRGGKYLFPFIYIVLTLFIAIYKRFIKDGFKYDVAIAFSGHYNDLTFVANNFVRADKKTGLFVAAGDEVLEIVELQAPGKKKMRAADYLNGHGFADGARFA